MYSESYFKKIQNEQLPSCFEAEILQSNQETQQFQHCQLLNFKENTKGMGASLTVEEMLAYTGLLWD